MALDVSPEMAAKIDAVGDRPLLDSVFVPRKDGGASAEKTQGAKGWYLSSPEDGWQLHGPFEGAD